MSCDVFQKCYPGSSLTAGWREILDGAKKPAGGCASEQLVVETQEGG